MSEEDDLEWENGGEGEGEGEESEIEEKEEPPKIEAPPPPPPVYQIPPRRIDPLSLVMNLNKEMDFLSSHINHTCTMFKYGEYGK